MRAVKGTVVYVVSAGFGLTSLGLTPLARPAIAAPVAQPLSKGPAPTRVLPAPQRTAPPAMTSQATPALPAGDSATRNAVASTNAEDMTVIGHRRMASGAAADYNKKMANLGPLGTRRTLDTPMSIMTVPHDVIVNQQARNVNDLMQYMPSVQLETRGDPGTSRPQSRGFEADVISNSRIDGLNAFTVTPYAAEQFDNVQVLNGLAGALYGPQNPAGTFEYGLKRPTDERINRLAVGVDSIGTLMENVDSSANMAGWVIASTCCMVTVRPMCRTVGCAVTWSVRISISMSTVTLSLNSMPAITRSMNVACPRASTWPDITCRRPPTWASRIWGRTMRASIPKTTSSWQR